MKEPSPRLLRAFSWAAIVVGTLLRLRQYAAHRSLWLDEAMLSLNITSRSFLGLARPLATDQAAPILFLWVERLAILALGVGEQALRLFPLVAGILLLFLFRRLAETLLAPAAAVLALWCVALSPALIYYSNEVKPYGPDALVATAVVSAAVVALRQPAGARVWRRLDLVAVWAALASIPSAFVLPAALVALAADRRARTEPGRRREVLLALGPALAMFGVAFLVCYRAAMADSYLRVFWQPYFLTPFRTGFFPRAWYAAGTTLEAMFMGGGGGLWRHTASLVLLLPLAWGLRQMWRTWGWPIAFLLAGPMMFALSASALRWYPFAPRLMLFAAPAAIILVCAGLFDVGDRLRHRTGASFLPVVLPLAALLLALPVVDGARRLVAPDRPQDLAPLLGVLEKSREAGDAVYVFNRAVPAWLYYTTDWHHPDLDRIGLLGTLVSSGGKAFRAAPSRRHRVDREGDELAFPYRGGLEVLGVPTGQGPTLSSRGQESPDAGWEENEARRLRAAVGSARNGWVVMSFYQSEVAGTLTAAIEAKGGRLTGRWTAQDALLLRFSFSQGGDLAVAR